MDLHKIEDHLSIAVGGYLYSTVRGVGFCRICTTPIDSKYSQCVACNKLAQDASLNGFILADQVVPLVYGPDEPQTNLLLRGYKDVSPGHAPQPELLSSMTLILAMGLLAHKTCLEQSVGTITGISYVPSSRLRPNQPLVKIAQFMSNQSGIPLIESKFVGQLSESNQSSPRILRPNDYEVGQLDGNQHILLIDDTWASGNHAQSVAAQFKKRVTTRVSIMVAARWLNLQWNESSQFAAGQMKTKPYSSFECAVCGVQKCIPPD